MNSYLSIYSNPAYSQNRFLIKFAFSNIESAKELFHSVPTASSKHKYFIDLVVLTNYNISGIHLIGRKMADSKFHLIILIIKLLCKLNKYEKSTKN